MRKFFIVLTLVVCASLKAEAQPPLTAEWDMPFTTVAEAQGYIYTYFLDSNAGVDFPTVICGSRTVGTEQVTTCASPLPIPSVGSHTIYLVVRNEYASSPKSETVTFRYPVRPEAPKNLRIVRE